MNFASIVILVILAAWFLFSVFHLVNKRKKGGSCMGNCGSCSYCGNCAKKEWSEYRKRSELKEQKEHEEQKEHKEQSEHKEN